MDYEKAYKEAIERLKGLIEGTREDRCVITEEDIIGIFPELKESEDERIRKMIINTLNRDKILTEDEAYDCVTWLEKQAPKIKWTEEDEKCIDNCCLLIGAADDCYEKTFKDDCIHYLQSLKERMEQ